MSKQVYGNPVSRSSSTVYSADSAVGVISSGAIFHNSYSSNIDNSKGDTFKKSRIKESDKNEKKVNDINDIPTVKRSQAYIDKMNAVGDELDAQVERGERKVYTNLDDMFADMEKEANGI